MDLNIAVEEDGMVRLNGERYDSPGVADLPEFTAALTRVAKDTRLSGAKVHVTVSTAAHAPGGRLVDVLNTLNKTGAWNITLTVKE